MSALCSNLKDILQRVVPVLSLLVATFLIGNFSFARADSRPLIESKMVLVTGGKFTPIIKASGKPAPSRDIAPFFLDRYPVSSDEFISFVKANSEWRRSQIKRLFADDGYLRHWKSDLSSGDKSNTPVTEVSWYAARAYCKSQNKRLPNAGEWEYVALASETKPDASGDPKFAARILAWYSSRNSTEMQIGRFRNYWGIYDIHGLIWEWIEDFNGEFTSGDSRGDNSQDESAFCGGGVLNVNDRSRTEYSAFMRYAFRGSLKGNYTVDKLGFRCAKNI